MAKADLLLDKFGDRHNALHCYIRALRNMGEISVNVLRSNNITED
jgi:hypothetical protein